MKKTRQILVRFPEYYLVVLALLAGYTPPFTFNPIFIGLAVIPILQIVFNGKISGLIIANLFLLANLYMLSALISEFNNFTEFNNSAAKLLLGGLSLWCFNIFSSGVMIYKYMRSDNMNKPSINYKTHEI